MEFKSDKPIFEQLDREQLETLLRVFNSEEFVLYRDVMTASKSKRVSDLYNLVTNGDISNERVQREIARKQGEIGAIDTLILNMGSIIDQHISKLEEQKKEEGKKK